MGLTPKPGDAGDGTKPEPLRRMDATRRPERERAAPLEAARVAASRQYGAAGQPFTLSLSALAIVILTTLSASFLICSPVAGLRTIRSGRSRQ